MVQIGYYPGQGMVRKPRGSDQRFPTNAYTFDEINRWVDQLDFEVEGFPDYISDQVVSDFKRALKVSAEPKKSTYDTQRALLFGDIDETPGVQLQVNLNPIDWIQDPAKTFQKTLDGWKKSITNTTDVNNWIERRYFWEPLVSGREDLAPASDESQIPPLFEPAQKVAQDVIYRQDLPDKQGGKNPFKLANMGIMETAPWKNRKTATGGQNGDEVQTSSVPGTNRNSVYDQAAENFLSFTENAESATKRNGAYNDVRRSSSRAIRVELENRFGVRSPATATDLNLPVGDQDLISYHPEFKFKLVKSFNTSGTGINSITKDQALELMNFSAAQELATSMQTFAAGMGGPGGLVQLNKTLANIALEGNNAVDLYKKQLVLKDVLINSKNDLVTKEKARLGAIESWIRDCGTNSGLSQDKIDATVRAFRNDPLRKRYEAKIDRLGELLDGAIGRADGVSNDSSVATSIIRSLRPDATNIQNSISNSGFFGKGILHEQLEMVNASIMNKRSVYAGQGKMDELLNAAINLANDQTGLKTGIPNVENILDVTGRNFHRNDISDFLENVQEGKLFDIYVLQPFRNKLGYTKPVTQFLEKRHYFGLKYDPDQFEASIRAMENGTKLLKRGDDGNLLLDADGKPIPDRVKYLQLQDWEYIKLDKYVRYMPKNTFRLRNLAGQSFRVEGGKHFGAATDIYKELSRVLTPAEADQMGLAGLPQGELLHYGSLGALIDARGRFAGFRGQTRAEVLGNGRNLVMLLNGKIPSGYTFPNTWKEDDIERFLHHKAGYFKAWLKKHDKQLKLSFDADGNLITDGPGLGQNVDALTSLFKQLGGRITSNDFIDITWSHVGYLQLLSSYANRLQTWALKKIAPLVAPYYQVKNAVINSISLGLTRLLQAAAGSTTAGIGAAIGKFLEPVIRFVVRSVVNTAEKFITAFIRGDIAGFMKEMDKFVANSVRYALYILLVPLSIAVGISFIFFGATLTTFSQVDWTRGGQASGIVVPPGVGNYTSCPNPAYNSPASGTGNFTDAQLRACFIFDDAASGSGIPHGSFNLTNWPEANITMFMNALRRINAATGSYFDQLCANGNQVHLLRSPDQPGYCGHVFGSAIVFLSTCSYSELNYITYLLAHESGHVFDNRTGMENTFIAATISQEGTLPTYDLSCGSANTPSEDFAETIGNLVHVNCGSCGGWAQNNASNYETFWSQFGYHYNWIRNLFGLSSAL